MLGKDSKRLQKRVFKLGRMLFSLENCRHEHEKCLDTLFTRIDYSDADHIESVDCAVGRQEEPEALISYVRAKHIDCVWIDAACLISPTGKRVLVAGSSQAGKSTTALALALGYNWKVLSEDVTLIDYNSNNILSFPAPVALKSGAVQMIKDATGHEPTVFSETWVPLGTMAERQNRAAFFEVAILLVDVAVAMQPFEIKPVSAQSFVRMLLNRSNLLRLQGSPDKMALSLAAGACFTLKGGTLKERLAFVRAREEAGRMQ